MIICRTPFRVSFFGGGTDYPDWYLQNGGSVVSASINKYSYINARWLPPFFDFNFRVRYFNKEEVAKLSDIQHPSVRECAKFVGVERGFEVNHTADLPARSGLGSSSSFTVGMLHAFYALMGKMPAKRQLATEAIHVEQNLIREAVGSQDQIAAAFGGLNHILFSKEGSFEVCPITINRSRKLEFEQNLLLCFTGFARTASEIAEKQIAATQKNTGNLQTMTELCEEGLTMLVNDDVPISEIGELLNEQWRVKKRLSDVITNPTIDEIFQRGIRAGAVGGKLLGAGGGGFLLFFAPPERHESIKAALKDNIFVPINFEEQGSQIVFHSHE